MEVKCESFFNFFKDEPESKEKGDDEEKDAPEDADDLMDDH